jgi:hypothetical protein
VSLDSMMLQLPCWYIKHGLAITNKMTTKQQIKPAKPTYFHNRWLKAYGLCVTARDAATGKISSVEC